jgi:hypothetical protein
VQVRSACEIAIGPIREARGNCGRRDGGVAGVLTYAERLVDLGGLVVAVGLGSVGPRCPLQLSGHAGCPLSCGEHVGRDGRRSIERLIVCSSWEEAASKSTG